MYLILFSQIYKSATPFIFELFSTQNNTTIIIILIMTNFPSIHFNCLICLGQHHTPNIHCFGLLCYGQYHRLDIINVRRATHPQHQPRRCYAPVAAIDNLAPRQQMANTSYRSQSPRVNPTLPLPVLGNSRVDSSSSSSGSGDGSVSSYHDQALRMHNSIRRAYQTIVNPSPNNLPKLGKYGLLNLNQRVMKYPRVWRWLVGVVELNDEEDDKDKDAEEKNEGNKDDADKDDDWYLEDDNSDEEDEDDEWYLDDDEDKDDKHNEEPEELWAWMCPNNTDRKDFDKKEHGDEGNSKENREEWGDGWELA